MSVSGQAAGMCTAYSREADKARLAAPPRMAGFTYIEVIVATALIIVALVPALDALSVGVKGSGIHEDTTREHYYLTTKMEEMLATAYNELDAEALAVGDPGTPTAFSDTVTPPDGRSLVRQVYLSRYDADNADGDNDHFTGTDDGLLWVKVELEGLGRSLEVLTHAYE